MSFRIIARLDIKGPNLIKGVRFEGLRVLGNPNDFAFKYYLDGADEILYLDTVASLYNRNHICEFLKENAKNIFIPITVGGGIRKLDDVKKLLQSGADKVALNTMAIKRPKILSEISQKYGSQCTVLSVEAKNIGSGLWEAYQENGRERTGLDVLKWVVQAEKLGVGEILITSIDKDGTKEGFDLCLLQAVSQRVSVPLIASGGLGRPDHLKPILHKNIADAAAVATGLHYGCFTIAKLKETVASEEKNYHS